MAQPAISIKGVTKEFKLPHEKTVSIKSGIVHIFKKKDKTVTTQRTLGGVSFDVREGEFFGILGRNGSGKSTLLKILAEIYKPTKGSVSVSGKLVPFIELGVGFNPDLTGRENVYLNGALLGFSKKDIDDRYDEIVAFAELEPFMDQKLKNYSSGMQVRLAFSVATRAEADILLVDEVLAVGDADFQRKCFDYFKSLKKSGKTVVFVTHDMSAVREYCDKAILIENGKIIHEGNASDIANEYLKLFNDQNIIDTENKQHWGDGRVKVEKLTVKCTRENFTINVALKSGKEAVGEVRFGLKIKDQEGNLVAGVNNLTALNSQKLVFGKNETKNITLSSLNVFGNQTYTIDATIVSPDSTIVYDSWENIKKFRSSTQDAY